MPRRKLVAVYLGLVGVPLLGLLGVLRVGRRLAAPISVGGSWNLQADFRTLTEAPCRELLSSINQPFLSISQSGANLVFTLNNSQKTTVVGTLNRTTLAMGGAEPLSSPSRTCADPQAIYLAATVSTQGKNRVLTGTLGISGCASCAPVSFHAVRQASGGGR
ncbi:MAG TPA: hypothetical protein VGW33_01095 [Terriglobia bacterium]|nr:hypothetical protein [Terriglobia bacterium]